MRKGGGAGCGAGCGAVVRGVHGKQGEAEAKDGSSSCSVEDQAEVADPVAKRAKMAVVGDSEGAAEARADDMAGDDGMTNGHESSGCAPQEAVLAAARLLRKSTAIVVAAGAGMSLDSGLPDYRDAKEWQAAFPMLARRGLRYRDMAQGRHFEESPRVVWAWYKHRYDTYHTVQPHNGHAILKRWCDAAEHGARVFTSNVDGLFQRAGFHHSSVVECHGSMARLQCSRGGHGLWKSDATFRNLRFNKETYQVPEDQLPRCRSYGCKHTARPNILLFDDDRWDASAVAQRRQRYTTWLHALPADSVLTVLEIGAGTAVPTVRMEVDRIVAERLAHQQAQTHVIRINPDGDDDGNTSATGGGGGSRGNACRGRYSRNHGSCDSTQPGKASGGAGERQQEPRSAASATKQRPATVASTAAEMKPPPASWTLLQWPGEHVLVRERAITALQRIEDAMGTAGCV